MDFATGTIPSFHHSIPGGWNGSLQVVPTAGRTLDGGSVNSAVSFKVFTRSLLKVYKHFCRIDAICNREFMCCYRKVISVADPGGSTRDARTPPPAPSPSHTHTHLWIQYLSFSCSFQQKKSQYNSLASASSMVGAITLLEKSWIRRCNIIDQIRWT